MIDYFVHIRECTVYTYIADYKRTHIYGLLVPDLYTLPTCLLTMISSYTKGSFPEMFIHN